MDSLGISLSNDNSPKEATAAAAAEEDDDEEEAPEDLGYEVTDTPDTAAANWSSLPKPKASVALEGEGANDLDALEELVPNLKHRRGSCEFKEGALTVAREVDVDDVIRASANEKTSPPSQPQKEDRRQSMQSAASSTFNHNISSTVEPAEIKRFDSMRVQESIDDLSGNPGKPAAKGDGDDDSYASSSTDEHNNGEGDDDYLAKAGLYDGLGDNESDTPAPGEGNNVTEKTSATAAAVPKEFINMSSGQSLSTATQTHEVRMPMYLPTFKPATGCTNASDFIVRCFVARLRSGITVVKHGRSRWCKSRLRILHIHPDGCSLSWKPAEGEPTSNRRPPKLDLTQCLEVRHAWSPDPQNPMYTGTSILRQKCEAANAHKSFALIFPKRTVDITAVTADQCKVLMEGFSALCFRLQVADLAGKGNSSATKKGGARGMPEEDGISTTASVTLTNVSTPKGLPAKSG